jgi:hypothetical protein
MPPTHSDLIRLIEEDLYHEVRFLLVGAANWVAADAANRQVAGSPAETSLPAHLIVMSMDSAFLHARNLYEFFTTPRNVAQRRLGDRATWLTFNAAAPQRSTLYNQWRPVLHERLVHLSITRPNPVSASGAPLGATALNGEVLNFAQDVLNLWRAFEADPSVLAFKSPLEGARKQAIDQARQASARLGQAPLAL